MGSFANTLFSALLGWVQSVASSIWAFFSDERGGGLLKWIGEHWLPLAAFFCLCGIALDLAFTLHLKRNKRLAFRHVPPDSGDASDPVPETEEPAASDFGTDSMIHSTDPYAEPPENTVNPEDEAEDLSRWTPSDPLPSIPEKISAPEPQVTAAGYVIPADSPYRRPAAPSQDAAFSTPAALPPDPSHPAPASSGRRRRTIKVRDLFSNPEEELLEFEAPQNLIDRKQAYRRPVYPSTWNQGKDREE